MALAAAGSGFALSQRGNSTASFVTEPVTYGTVEQAITASGTIQPVSELGLDFGQTGALVTAVNVKPGQKVRPGEVLATENDSSLETQLAEAEANVAIAKAKLALDESGPSASELVSAENSLASAKNSLSEAQASLTTAEQENSTGLASSTVTASEEAQSSANALSAAQLEVQKTETADAEALLQAEQQLSNDQAALANDNQVVANDNQNSQITIDQAEEEVTQAENTLQDEETTLGNDQSVLETAQSQLQNMVSSVPSYSPSDDLTDTQNLLGSDQILQQELQAELATAQSNLSAAEQQEQTDCTTSPSSSQCSNDKSTVSSDQQLVSNYEAEVNLASSAINDASKVVSDLEQVGKDDAAVSNAEATVAADQTKAAQTLQQDEDAVSNAQAALNDAEQNLSNVEQTNQENLASAQTSLSSAQQTAETDATQELAAALAEEQAVCNPQPGTTPPVSCSEAKNQVQQAETSLANNTNAIDQAQVLADATEVKDQASIQAADQLVANAEVQLQNDKSSEAALYAPPQPGTIQLDQAGISSAEASVANVQNEIAQSEIVAPVAGTILQVNISVGQPATTGSGSGGASGASGGASGATSSSGSTVSGAIIMQATNSFEAVTSVSAADIGQVHVNEQAQVTPDGQTTPLPATVSEITPDATTTSGVSSFPVNVVITSDPSNLFTGTTATVSIITKDVPEVLTVPSSAVHTIGKTSFVFVLKNGKEVRQSIVVGAVGTTTTQIISGLKAGERVVIANRAAPLPGTTSTPGRFGGFGGAGFGGFGGAGFSGRVAP